MRVKENGKVNQVIYIQVILVEIEKMVLESIIGQMVIIIKVNFVRIYVKVKVI